MHAAGAPVSSSAVQSDIIRFGQVVLSLPGMAELRPRLKLLLPLPLPLPPLLQLLLRDVGIYRLGRSDVHRCIIQDHRREDGRKKLVDCGVDL